MDMDKTATELRGKRPELLEGLEELEKAADVVRLSVMSIYEWLRVGVGCDDPMRKELCQPAPQPPLIIERVNHLSGLRQKLYETNSYLENIMSAIREI